MGLHVFQDSVSDLIRAYVSITSHFREKKSAHLFFAKIKEPDCKIPNTFFFTYLQFFEQKNQIIVYTDI